MTRSFVGEICHHCERPDEYEVTHYPGCASDCYLCDVCLMLARAPVDCFQCLAELFPEVA